MNSFILVVSWDERPHLTPYVGPFESRAEAEDWGRLNVVGGDSQWMATELAYPYMRTSGGVVKGAKRDEAQAALVRVRALADAFADDGLARHGGNVAWHIEEAIANEKGDFPDAADQRIASQRERAESAESDLRALREGLEALADEWERAAIARLTADYAASQLRARLSDLRN